MAVFTDLTARARIREAALAQFAEVGFERATIRGIAASAGVSAGLVRHHFGSKEALRDAVDEHVVAEIRRLNEEILAAGDRGNIATAAISRRATKPFEAYLARAMMDGSPTIATLFDNMVEPTELWIARADRSRSDPPFTDTRTRAAVLGAMAFGVQLMRDHLSRVLGIDAGSPEGEYRVSLALLDLYSHALLTPDLAATAKDLLQQDLPTPPSHLEERIS
jgi:AcrR family transcriptional regulator